MTPLSPSRIAARAMRIEPTGTHRAASDGACAVCGGPIRQGEWISHLDLPGSFTNQSSLAYPAGESKCGHCTAIFANPRFFLGVGSNALYTEDGAYPIARKVHRAWAIMNLPETPFVMCLQNAKSQHVVWRAPVSLSPGLIMLRIGERLLRVRRDALLRGMEVAARFHEAREAALASGGKKRKIAITDPESPFVSSHGFDGLCQTPKSWVADLVRDGVLPKSDVATLLSLTSGETWLMSTALCSSPELPPLLSMTQDKLSDETQGALQ